MRENPLILFTSIAIAYIFVLFSSSFRLAANRLPTVRLIELWMVFLIFRGVDAMDRSDSIITEYTSSFSSNSGVTFVLHKWDD